MIACRSGGRALAVLACTALLHAALGAAPAAGDLPDAPTLLADLGFTSDQIADVQAGKLVHADLPPASERELTTTFAFQVSVTPNVLVKDARQGLLEKVDPDSLGFGTIGSGGLADFAKLALRPDAASQAQAYQSATPGGSLNLSTAEIAAFDALAGSPPSAVENQVRRALLARVTSYRAQGLAGIAPYARDGGKQRSAADELRTATLASKPLQKYAPAAYQLLLSYPNQKPPDTQESFRWAQFEAHGVPTIVLIHGLSVPDGDAWIVAQRHFYVSTGYNAEQAIGAFLPVQGGTVVVYGNRTSTDQITGFGGGAKRSLGSRVLASQLETLFERARAGAK